MEIKNPHRCVVDAEGFFVKFVSMYDPQGNKLEQPYRYKMQEGERLVDSDYPPQEMQWVNGAVVGILRGRWDDETAAWAEGATAAEITAWEAEHPAPEPTGPDELTQTQLAVAELAQVVEDNNTANQLAVAELAEALMGGEA